MTLALFRVAAKPKTIHSKADIGPGSLYLLFLARMVVQTDSSVQETFDLLATPCSNCPIARGLVLKVRVVRGKLEANFSHLWPYLRVIVLNMAATRKQWSTFKPRKQLCHRSERQ